MLKLPLFLLCLCLLLAFVKTASTITLTDKSASDLVIGRWDQLFQITFTIGNSLPLISFIQLKSQMSLPFTLGLAFALDVHQPCQLFQNGVEIILIECKQINKAPDAVLVMLTSTTLIDPTQGTLMLQLNGVYVSTSFAYPYQFASIGSFDQYFQPIDSSTSPLAIYYYSSDDIAITINRASYSQLDAGIQGSLLIELTMPVSALQRKTDVLFIYTDVLFKFNTDKPGMACIITQTTTIWSSCTITNTYLRLVRSALDVTNESSFQIQLKGIYIPSLECMVQAKSFNKYSLMMYETEPTKLAAGVSHPEKWLDYTQLRLSKKYAQVGYPQQLLFTIKLPKAIVQTSLVYVSHPYIYVRPTTTLYQPYCHIDTNTYVRCDLLDDASSVVFGGLTLLIRDFPATIPANRAWDLLIEFASVASIISPPEPIYFFVAAAIEGTSTFSYYGYVQDGPTTASSIATVTVNAVTVTSTTWVTDLDLGLTFITSAPISKGSSVSVGLDSTWLRRDAANTLKSCLYSTSSATCSIKGQSVLVTSEQTNANTEIAIKLQGLPIIDKANCNSQRLSVAIIDPSGSVLAVSAPYALSNAFCSNLVQTDPRQWQWTMFDANDVPKAITTVTLYPGTESPPIRLYPGNGFRSPMSQRINIAPSINGVRYFALDPPEPTVRLGEYFIDLRITCLPSTSPGDYPTSFTLTPVADFPSDIPPTTNYYYAPPNLVITLASTKAPIQAPAFTTVRIPVLGVSLPITLSLNGYAPLDADMSVQGTIPLSPDLRIDFGRNSEFFFANGFDATTNWVQFVSQDQPNVIERETTVSLQVKSPYDAYFQLSATEIKIQVETSPNQHDLATPTLKVELTTQTPTSTTFTLKSDWELKVYYVATLYDNDDQEYIQFNTKMHNYNYILDRLPFGSPTYRFLNDKMQTQFGFQAYHSGTQTLVLRNLKANRNYQVSFWGQSLMLAQSKVNEFKFRTKDNGDQLWKLELDVTTKSIDGVMCGLAQAFRYPIDQILTINSYNCSTKPEYDAPFPAYEKYFYMYPFDGIDQPNVPGSTNEVLDFQGGANNILSKLTAQNVKSIKFLKKVALSIPAFDKVGNITSTATTVTVSNIALKSNGFIWAVAEHLNISIKGRVIYVDTPTLPQMKRALNSTGLPADAAAFGIYDGQPIALEFNGLSSESHYRISLIATSEDPSIYQQISETATLEIDTLPGHGYKLFLGVIIIMMFVLG